MFDLVEKMLEYEPDERLTLDEALRHEFFKGLAPEQMLDHGPIPGASRRSSTLEATERRNSKDGVQTRSAAALASASSGYDRYMPRSHRA